MAGKLNVDRRSGTFLGTFELSDEQVQMLRAERLYVDVHTTHPDGELGDQLRPALDRAGVVANPHEFRFVGLSWQPMTCPSLSTSLRQALSGS